MSQVIVVCTDDAALAKKIRFLMARHQRKLEVFSTLDDARNYIRNNGADLAIFSRLLSGLDMVETTIQLDAALGMPITLVLGGEAADCPSFIRLLPDPIDTQSIYETANQALTDSAEPADIHFETSEANVDATMLCAPPFDPKNIPAVKSENAFGNAGFSDILAAAAIDDAVQEKSSPQSPKFQTAPMPKIPAPLAHDFEDEPHTDGSIEVDVEIDLTPETDIHSLAREQTPVVDPAQIEGEMRVADFAKVLFGCARDQVDGVIRISRDTDRFDIFLEKGAPIFVDRRQSGDPLGRILVNQGRITEAQYGTAAKACLESGQNISDTLLSQSLISIDTLALELGKNASEQIINCFDNEDGTYCFIPNVRPSETAQRFQLDINPILKSGLDHARLTVVEEIFPKASARYFKLSAPIDEVVRQFDLDATDSAFLEYSGKAYNVSDAAELASFPKVRAARLLALLHICELIEDFTPGVSEFEARLAEERSRPVKEASPDVVAEPLSAHDYTQTEPPEPEASDVKPEPSGIDASAARPIQAEPAPNAIEAEPLDDDEPQKDAVGALASADFAAKSESPAFGAVAFEPLEDSPPTPQATALDLFANLSAVATDDSEETMEFDDDDIDAALSEIPSSSDPAPALANEAIASITSDDVESVQNVLAETAKGADARSGVAAQVAPALSAAASINVDAPLPPETPRPISSVKPPPPPAATSPGRPSSIAPPPPPAATQLPQENRPSSKSSRPASAARPRTASLSIPPMPGPPPGVQGRFLAPIDFADPAPRNIEGKLVDTAARKRSRDAFQRGVTLLGQGQFAEAESSFRQAIQQCADEHVYLVGLARSLYYNSEYDRDGKISSLQTVIARARDLAPTDSRVATLQEWIDAARG